MMDESQKLREMIKRRDESAERLIVEYIDKYGRAYSKELKGPAGDLSLTHVRTLLRRLENRGVLESWLVNPPHEDCRSSGLQRRYYKRSCWKLIAPDGRLIAEKPYYLIWASAY